MRIIAAGSWAYRRRVGTVAACVVLLPASAAGQSAPEAGTIRERIAEQRDLIAQQADQLDRQQQALERQRRELDRLQRQLDRLDSVRARGTSRSGDADRQNGADAAAGSTRTAQADGQDAQPNQGAAPPGEEPQRERPEIRVLQQEGGVLLREGQVAFEPSLQYTNASVSRVEVAGFSVLPAIVVGNINIEELDRESLVASNTFRYGVTDTFEVELRVPYVYRSESETSRPVGEGTSDPQTFDTDGDGLGDVEVAAHYQLPQDWTGDGFVVTNLRLKTRTGEGPFEVDTTGGGNNQRQAELPTGSGFYSVTPSVTGIWPADPAVLFGNVSYTYTIARDIAGVGEVDPGDQLGFNVGTGISLNENFSVSLAIDHSIIFETERDGETTPGSDIVHVASFQVGGSYDVSDNVAIDLQFGIGATEDAPDFSAMLSLPITFQAF